METPPKKQTNKLLTTWYLKTYDEITRGTFLQSTSTDVSHCLCV